IEALPKSILYWRSLTHWIGGIGIVILVIAILPILRIAGYQLFSMESSGTMFEKIKPRTREVAKRLWGIYLMLTVILVGLLMAGNVSFYESLTLAFGTVATGGFAVTNDSVMGYAPYVQYIIMIFMLLSGMNFTLHYFLLKGDFKKITQNTELKVYTGIILIVGTIITFILFFSSDLDFEMSFRESFFQVVSIITATGFATADYMEWKEIAWVLIFALMFVGASVGSTGGGIKVIRHVVAFKQIRNFTKKLLHPSSVRVVKVNGRTIPEANANSILTFILIYLGIFGFSSLVMASLGLDFETSMGSVITTMGGIGPGIGTVGPASNFAHIPVFGKMYLAVLMITGRLEIITLWIIFSSAFWKK
ncbi:MAG: TrkH family potassium uptake protein, partial [Chlorobi bacterium]|nr:TrkH family potassium uptake protein [Chlorobiota bacterium]